MAKGYSLALRQRVFGAYERGEGAREQIARRFAVSVSFVRDLARRFRESGEVAAKAYAGERTPAVDGVPAQAICAQVAAHNDLSIEEHRQALAVAGHPLLAHSTLGHWLPRLELTRKKDPQRRRGGHRARPGPARGLPGRSRRHPGRSVGLHR